MYGKQPTHAFLYQRMTDVYSITKNTNNPINKIFVFLSFTKAIKFGYNIMLKYEKYKAILDSCVAFIDINCIKKEKNENHNNNLICI